SGIRAEDLPEGTFLGKGAVLHGGQRLTVPAGTIAELSLEGGGTLRINENTEFVLPGAGLRQITLRAGEIVAIVAADEAPIKIASEGDVLTIARGEARALSRDGKHDYAVVYGDATVASGSQVVELGPGATLQTPLKQVGPVQAEVSLRPLAETTWARSFDLAAQMVDAVPPGVGSLTARRAGERIERYSLDLVDQRVNVTISGRIALTEIEQTFYNEAPAVLEGTYRFPIPADATISGLSLLVGNRWEDAAMLEKHRARRIFKQIVEATVPRDPALLEWEKGNIFKLKIFPIPGRGARKIRLRYTQVLPTVGDSLRYRYPLSGASSGATGTAIGNFSLSINVDREGLPADAMASMRTPMAELARRDLGDHIELQTEQQNFRPVHDLGVDIPLPPAEQRLHAETHLDRDGQAYFMVAVEPNLPLKTDKRPTRYAFVVDRSHSTTPELWTVARSLVGAMSSALDEQDRLTVLACDSACDMAPGGFHPPTEADLGIIDTFLGAQTLAGASDLGGMMRSAAETLRSAEGSDRSDLVIVYLGDGNATAGELAPDEILSHLAPVLAGIRVQVVAMGSRSDLLLLDALAEENGGDLVQADAKDNLRDLVRELRLRVAVPVAREVEVLLPKGMMYVHPSKVGGLRSGESLVLVGKLGGPVDGDLTIRAKGPGGEVVSDTFKVKLAADRVDPSARHSHLPRTWAAEEIEALTTSKGNAASKTIIDLSKRYTVLSRYTALLVLENDAMFREFNVVRNDGQTDEWRGGRGKGAGASGSSTVQAVPPTSPVEEAAAPAAKMAEGSKSKPTGSSETKKDSAPADGADSYPEGLEDRGGFGRNSPALDLADPYPDDPSVQSGGESTAKEAEGIDLDDEDLQTAPAKRRKKKAKGPTSAAPKRASVDAFGEPGMYDLDTGSGYGDQDYRPKIRISDKVAPSARNLAKIETLRSRRDADPTSRKAHRRLVQAAIYYGVPAALDYAKAWAEADPDHAPAVLAVADLLAAHGEPMALRAYASAVEVRPFSRKLQRRTAESLLGKGELTRACAHLRAVVSIEPKKAQHHADLARCLGALGRWQEAETAILDGRSRARDGRKALSQVALEISSRRVAPLRLSRLHSYPELRATLTWSGSSDLDIALVDHRGRRLSALRRELVRVREGEGEEVLTLRAIRRPVFIEVSRKSAAAGEVVVPAVNATLRLKTGDGRTRTFEITSEHTTLRLAKVSWSS
ncbi:MAG TPA: hypothetical protein ENJ18_10390, partial [Nannocystis exedens]|nr:hypothetical protein [Nannocystis exedens]